MTTLLVDTAVFLYARGGDHPYRVPCRTLVRVAGEGRIVLAASVELVQEYVHVLLRRSGPRDLVIADADRVRRLCELLAFDADVLRRAAALLGAHDFLGARDAVHAATALEHGIDVVLSPDRVFDRVPRLSRLDPVDAAVTYAG